MIDYGRIRGTIRPDEKVIDEHSVWVNTNIQEVEVSDEQGTHREYKFHQVQYTKEEYIKTIDAKNGDLEQQLTDAQIALCDIYEMLVLRGE